MKEAFFGTAHILKKSHHYMFSKIKDDTNEYLNSIKTK